MTRLASLFQLFLCAAAVCALGSTAVSPTANAAGLNPPAPGFDAAGSDAKAIEIADAVMEGLGGRAAWDATQFVTWKFFGRRFHAWDRHSGDVRIEGAHRDGPQYLILMNINTREGRAWEDGTEITTAGALEGLLQIGYEAWVNDSYWIFMPYKLKDSGVTLGYKGPMDLENGHPGHVLQLIFKDVGVTPDNRYEVFVDADEDRVVGWSYYPDRSDEEPQFTVPWQGWKRTGEIWLPTSHGEEAQHTYVAAHDKIARSVFTSPEPCELPGCREN